MWISKQILGFHNEPVVQRGNVTISGDSIEASSNQRSRNIFSFAPYGYQSKAPIGEEVLLLSCEDGQAAVGTRLKADGIENGEIKITSLGGASLVLKNDGTIVLNSLIIDKNGVVQDDI